MERHLAVADCNRKQPRLQWTRFHDRINCDQPGHAGLAGCRRSGGLKLGPQFCRAGSVEDVVEECLDRGRLGVEQFGKVFAWSWLALARSSS